MSKTPRKPGPKPTGNALVTWSCKLSKQDRDRIKQLGGGRWLRQQLAKRVDQAKP